MTTFSSEPGKQGFQAICHDMYKRFGACYANLKVLAKTDGEKELLTAQLHELRTAVRELLDKVKEAEHGE